MNELQAKKCDHAISLKNWEACGCVMKIKNKKIKNDYPSKKFLMEERILHIRLHQNNDTNELSDVQDVDSTVNKGTNSQITSEYG